MIMTYFIGSVDMEGISTEVFLGAKRGPADTDFQQYITRLFGIKKQCVVVLGCLILHYGV